MKLVMPISALAIALGSGAAYAGGNEHKSGSTAQFEALDRNSDQRLSQQEAQSDENIAGKFAALDVDGDGRISPEEMGAGLGGAFVLAR